MAFAESVAVGRNHRCAGKAIAGIWAGIGRDKDRRRCQLPGKHSGERYYVMQLKGRGLRSDKGRRHEWLTVDDAASSVESTGTSNLLYSAKAFEAVIFKK